ncbi:hypothetical protein PR003_g5759 [Phytophthora rubi]|uniref:vitamin-K-epoxide reductase (warfarin-sensitive) n=1 Tax=Phytophthora rubi TaxID=129364 RepID=A0A6A4FYV5_9STRA|nr:hypothetical protein PR003_g5759 [Phytophthora rubi]
MGVAVSAYGIHVKTQKIALKDEYTALCDLEAFSCSEVLTSEYSSLLSHLGLVKKHSVLDVSNAYLGVLVYALFVLYPVVRKVSYHAQFYVAVSSCAVVVMVYLAFILAFVLRDFCLVCVATRPTGSLRRCCGTRWRCFVRSGINCNHPKLTSLSRLSDYWSRKSDL